MADRNAENESNVSSLYYSIVVFVIGRRLNREHKFMEIMVFDPYGALLRPAENRIGSKPAP